MGLPAPKSFYIGESRMSAPRFEYGSCEVSDLTVVKRLVEQGEGKKPKEVADLYMDGRSVIGTKRFWTSLQSNFGFSKNIFKYFSHAEVFNRIAEVSPRSELNWCIEANGDEANMLAVTNPGKASLRYNDAIELINKHGGEDKYEYSDGIIQSRHFPIGNDHSYNIGGDAFENRFALDIPIDGFGNPSTYLMTMRLRCLNGNIAMTPAFRSEINIGRKEGTFALTRVLEGYNNEDGFIALRQRYDMSQKSFASLNEVNNTYKTLLRVGNAGGIRLAGDGVSLMETADDSILGRFNKMTGDIGEMYGLANYDSMSQKKQRTLPAKCTMYDLINFITEIASHKANTEGARTLQALHGDMIANEYDLEGTCTDGKDYRTFWMTDEEACKTKASLTLAS